MNFQLLHLFEIRSNGNEKIPLGVIYSFGLNWDSQNKILCPHFKTELVVLVWTLEILIPPVPKVCESLPSFCHHATGNTTALIIASTSI